MPVTPDPAKYLDQAVDQMAAVLTASTEFMHSSALVGGTGKVRRVDKYDAFVPRTANKGDVFCGIFCGGDRVGDLKTIVQQERFIDLAVVIFGKTVAGQEQRERKGRQDLWRDCQKMASVVFKLVAAETHGGGSSFDGFSSIADVVAIEPDEDHDEGKSQYSLSVTVSVRMRVKMNVGA